MYCTAAGDHSHEQPNVGHHVYERVGTYGDHAKSDRTIERLKVAVELGTPRSYIAAHCRYGQIEIWCRGSWHRLGHHLFTSTSAYKEILSTTDPGP